MAVGSEPTARLQKLIWGVGASHFHNDFFPSSFFFFFL
jgi:hypothetical protein